jgi:hypothetical protein
MNLEELTAYEQGYNTGRKHGVDAERTRIVGLFDAERDKQTVFDPDGLVSEYQEIIEGLR